MVNVLHARLSRFPPVGVLAAVVVRRASVILMMQACLGAEAGADAGALREHPLLSGTVYATFAGRRIPLPDARVTLIGARPPIRTETLSELTGDFQLVMSPISGLRVCAEAPGFTSRCLALGHTARRRLTQDLKVEVELVPSGGLVWGRVTMRDGNPCFGTTRVALVAGASPLRRVPTRANHRGEYVITSVPHRSSAEVRAACGHGQVAKAVRLEDEELSGRRPVDLELPNLPPVLELLVARDASGRPLRSASPGQTVVVNARVRDPDGDALTHRWSDEERGTLPEREATARWTLPAVPTRARLSLEVSDGRGGRLSTFLSLPTGITGAQFSGSVRGVDGASLPGAQLTIDGRTVAIQRTGRFEATVPEGERHVARASAPGHAPRVEILSHGASGLSLQLESSEVLAIDPSQAEVELADAETGTRLVLSTRSLVDARGRPPAEPLTAHLRASDEQRAPSGDGSGLRADGQPTRVEVHRELWLDIRGDSGQPYALTEGKGARVTFTVPDHPSRPSQGGLFIATFTEAGHWRLVDTAVRLPPEGSDGTATYEGTVSQLGGLALVEVFQDHNCIRLQADRTSTVVPLRLHISRYTGVMNGAPQYALERDLLVADYEHHAVLLKPNAHYRLVATPESLTGAPFDGPPLTRHFLTGGVIPFGGLLYPYGECDERAGFLQRSVPSAPPFLSKGTFGAAEADPYYAVTNANGQKSTFAGWKAANGFGQKTEYVARFFNKHELSLGRELVCVRSPLACYIRKYGEPGGPAAQALDFLAAGTHPTDIVAIDTLAGSPGIGFYAFGADGKMKPSTVFDLQGPKAMPAVCMGCHGAKDVEGLGLVPAYFVPVDPAAHVYPAGAPSAAEVLKIVNISVSQSTNTTLNIRRYIAEAMYRKPDFCNPTVPPCEPPGCPPPPEPPPPECNDPFFVQYDDRLPPTYRFAVSGEAVARPTLFKEVVRPFCQTCHMSRPGIDWYDASLLKANATLVRERVCGTHPLMPNTFAPYRNLWQGPQAMDLLMDFLGVPRCGPYVPTVSLHEDQFPVASP